MRRMLNKVLVFMIRCVATVIDLGCLVVEKTREIMIDLFIGRK